MEKMNSESSDHGSSPYNEMLVNRVSFDDAINIGIISKRKTVVKASMSFDNENKQLTIATENKELKIFIKFTDMLAFIPEKKMNTQVVLDINTFLSKNIRTTEENVAFRDNCFIAQLNFFPKFQIRKCNCCGWICCKCRTTLIERRAKNIELLIPLQKLDAVSNEFNKICSQFYLQSEINFDQKRKLLLFINPIGGSGKAIRIWNQVKSIFDLANTQIDVFRTQHYQHAYEHTLEMDFMKYNGIICCSGDGILHEVINAIFHRADKDEFINNVPLGIIPGGSANGMAKCICDASEELCKPENCAFIITKGQVKEIDVMEVKTLTREKPIYSFLSVSWGIIADIDLESEKLRCCGSFRFNIYAGIRFICFRDIFGALYYLPDNLKINGEFPDLNTPLQVIEEHDREDDNKNEPKFFRENSQFYFFLASNAPFIGETLNCAPKANLDDGFCDIIKMKISGGKCNLLKLLLNQEEGDYFDSNGNIREGSGVEYCKTKAWRLIPKNNLDQNDGIDESRNFLRYYSIDGERYPIEPIQVQTKSKALRFFCLDKTN